MNKSLLNLYKEYEFLILGILVLIAGIVDVIYTNTITLILAIITFGIWISSTAISFYKIEKYNDDYFRREIKRIDDEYKHKSEDIKNKHIKE